MSIDRTGRTGAGSGPTPAPSTGSPAAPRANAGGPASAAARAAAAEFPSPAGTAVLNLTDEQRAEISGLLGAMRSGKSIAEEVRKRIFGLLSGSQRRLLGAAYFIFSVRV